MESELFAELAGMGGHVGNDYSEYAHLHTYVERPDDFHKKLYDEKRVLNHAHFYEWDEWDDVPYLRPMSSMTEEEARDIAILHGNESVDILSIKVTDEYMDIILDDGVCGTYTETIWYNEIISSIDCFDYLNKKMFDFRGLIPKDLALSTEIYNPYKTSHL